MVNNLFQVPSIESEDTTMYVLVNIINICSLLVIKFVFCLKFSYFIVLRCTPEYFSKVLSTYLITFTKCVLSTYSSTFKTVSTQYLLKYFFLVLASSLVTSSHNLSYDPSPTIYAYIGANKHGLPSTNTYEY